MQSYGVYVFTLSIYNINFYGNETAGCPDLYLQVENKFEVISTLKYEVILNFLHIFLKNVSKEKNLA